MDKYLTGLKKLILSIDKSSTHEDLLTKFGAALLLILKIEQEQNQASVALTKSSQEREDEIAHIIDMGLQNERKYLNQMTAKMTEEQRKDVALLHEAIKKVARLPGPPGLPGVPGLPGKDAVVDEEKLVSTLMERMPKEDLRAEFEEKLALLRKEFVEAQPLGSRIGWGAHPIMVKGSGTVKHKNARVLNFTGSGVSGVTTQPDGTIDVSISGGAGFNKLDATGTVDGSNTSFTFSSAPSLIVVDGIPKQKTQSDGTVNWTGTTSIVLSVAPNYDIYGL